MFRIRIFRLLKLIPGINFIGISKRVPKTILIYTSFHFNSVQLMEYPPQAHRSSALCLFDQLPPYESSSFRIPALGKFNKSLVRKATNIQDQLCLL